MKLTKINRQEVRDYTSHEPVPSIEFTKGKVKGKIVLCQCWYKGHEFNDSLGECSVRYDDKNMFVQIKCRQPKNGRYYTPSDKQKEIMRAQIIADEVVSEFIN